MALGALLEVVQNRHGDIRVEDRVMQGGIEVREETAKDVEDGLVGVDEQVVNVILDGSFQKALVSFCNAYTFASGDQGTAVSTSPTSSRRVSASSRSARSSFSPATSVAFVSSSTKRSASSAFDGDELEDLRASIKPLRDDERSLRDANAEMVRRIAALEKENNQLVGEKEELARKASELQRRIDVLETTLM